MRRRLAVFTALAVAIPLCFMTPYVMFVTSAAAAPPSVLKTNFRAVKQDSVVLEAEVNPGELLTKYHFEYGLGACPATPPCTNIPAVDASIPAGADPVQVEAKVSGLAPGTTYHFRIVVKNANGKDESPDKAFTTFTVPPPFGPCPNDQIRLHNQMERFLDYSSANLPDCRAYEQASPVDKNGMDTTGLPSWVRTTPNGAAVSFMSTSPIPGGEGAQHEIPFWLASRGASSWSTQGLMPPAAKGDAVLVRGWSPDFSQVFSHALLFGPPKAAAFLSRDSANHSLAEIIAYGQATDEPPTSFAGSSPNGSIVVFESPAKLIPEAVEGKSNLYVWSRATKTLRLVSTLPGCALLPCSPPDGAFAGPYNWMQTPAPALEGDASLNGGGAAFNNYTQDQHAVSANGDRVYFTAAKTGQLYLRVNPTAEQSPITAGKCTDLAKACTLHVSASKKKNGLGPGGTDVNGPRPAAFQAASADGSLAFFTSPEKLTDNANTGPEPEAPTLSRAEIDGSPVEAKFLPKQATGIATNGTHIYWANPDTDTIGRAKLNGAGAPSEINDEFIKDADNPQYVAVDGTHVYWTNAGDGKDGNGTIGRAKLGLTEGEEVEQDYVTGAHNPQGIAVNATHVFWSNAGGELETRTIGRAKLGATEAEEVKGDFIPVDFGSQQWTPQGIAANATHIYITVDGVGSGSFIFQYEIDGNAASRVLFFDDVHPNLPGVRGIALDANFVYWARQGKDAIGRVKLDFKGTPEPEWIKEAGHPFGLAQDGTRIYWSANSEVIPNPGNDLYRFEASTGNLSDLTPDPGDKNGAEVKGVLGTSTDGAYVYFAANGVLGAGATAGDCHGVVSEDSLGFSGQCNLYLAHKDDPPLFITRLDASGAGDRSDATNWMSRVTAGDVYHKTARVSADGSTLLFRSQRQLGTYENKGTPELYRYRVGQGITCVSCDPTGTPPTGTPGLGSIAPSFLIPRLPATVLARNLSADGDRVFFESTDALVPTDTNGEAGCPKVGTERYVFPTCLDVYEWEAQGSGSCTSAGGCLYLLSTGKSPRASFFGDASADGAKAFLVTRAKLAGQDQDQLYDVYGATVDGGLASQNQPPPPSCTSIEGCGGPVAPAPPVETPGTYTFTGPGNEKAKARCPKGKRKVRVKGKTRCVAKGKTKGKGKGRANKTTGRAGR